MYAYCNLRHVQSLNFQRAVVPPPEVAAVLLGLYDTMARCWIDKNKKELGKIGDNEKDKLLKQWWANLETYLPAFNRAKTTSDPLLKAWLNGGKLTKETLVNVVRTVMVWVSWIHEDVGHSAAAYVYNGIHTPMCVPEDGVGIPLRSFAFNAAAYRGFVFLHRATLLEKPPAYWFNGVEGKDGDKQCFVDFQDSLRSLGETDSAFSECDTSGFYSCVDRVETAVSS